MAIIRSTVIGKAKGSVGNVTLSYRSGETVAKEKVAFPKNPKTARQMARRVRWANIVNFWQSFGGNLHPSFELAEGRVSDFNLFIGRNVNVPLYLTSEQANAGGCLVTGYMLTEGTLPSISIGTTANGVITSDIKVGSLVINDETTMAALSAAIIANNTGWQYGDQLSAFVFVQKVNTVTRIPYVETKAFELTLSETDENLVVDYLGNDPSAFAVVDQKIAFNAVVNGGGSYVHSRISPEGKTLVSTQYVTVTNDLESNFQTDSQMIAAIISYGGKTTQAFLTPNIDQIVAPVTP